MSQTPAASVPAILLVEDDEQVRGMIRSLLTTNGFRVLEARTGAEGLEIGRKYGNEIALLLSDMLLPELSGFDVALEIRRQHPKLKVLFITGYVEGDIVQRCVSELGADFLDKPFQPAELLARVRAALGHEPIPTGEALS